MKDYLVWHYLTIRSDDIQVGDYYCFSDPGVNDKVLVKGTNGKFGYLVKLSLTEVTLMRLKEKRKNFVWQAVRKSKIKKNNHYQVQGKLIYNLSRVNL